MLLRRLSTALFVLVFTASAADAMMLCAGMAMAAANPHACCVGEAPKPTSPGEAMACCAMAERSDDQGPAGAPVGLLDGLAAHVPVLPDASPPDSAPAFRGHETDVHRGPPSVPIYLQHRSLLI